MDLALNNLLRLICNKTQTTGTNKPKNEVSLCNIMAEGFRFMPLGLVRLRTFRLSAWVT